MQGNMRIKRQKHDISFFYRALTMAYAAELTSDCKRLLSDDKLVFDLTFSQLGCNDVRIIILEQGVSQ
jgi:hypothetical protein